MKQILKYTIAGLLITGVIFSCKKNDDEFFDTSSLTIVNAISGGNTIITNFNSGAKLVYYKTATQIPINSSAQFQGHIGDVPLAFSLLSDTTTNIFKSTIKMEPNSIRTLFLTGPLTSIDAVFTDDKVPAFAVVDSLVGVRFINTSKGSLPLSVNIKDQATPFIANLPYKGASAFVGYSAKKVVPEVSSYVFEIRDAASAKLITSYTLSSLTTKLGKSITVALMGLPAGAGVNAQATVVVNNY